MPGGARRSFAVAAVVCSLTFYFISVIFYVFYLGCRMALWPFSCVAVWLCGCVVVWLCGCVAVWLCGSVVVWLCGCVVAWLCVCVVVCVVCVVCLWVFFGDLQPVGNYNKHLLHITNPLHVYFHVHGVWGVVLWWGVVWCGCVVVCCVV